MKNFRDGNYDDDEFEDNYQHVEKIKKHKKNKESIETDFSDRKWSKTKYNNARKIKNRRFDED